MTPDWTSMTLEDYRRLNPTRPITDRPIGGTTQAKRDIDALESRAHESPDTDQIDRTDALQRVIAERRRRAEPTGCGTLAGYYAHRGRNEWPCALCRTARNNHDKETA